MDRAMPMCSRSRIVLGLTRRRAHLYNEAGNMNNNAIALAGAA